MAGKLARLRDFLAADLAAAGLALPADLPSPQVCAEVYAAFAARTRIVGEEYLPRLLAGGPCVFEGAQGVLLDEWFGFDPHTTWSTTTFANAGTLLAEAGLAPDAAFRLGVVRTYTTRHGAGPLVTEDPRWTAELPEPHNGTGEWQGAFRSGPFDAVAHRYAVAVCGGVDGLAVGHADVVRPGFQYCRAYRTPGAEDVVTALPVSPRPDLEFQRVLTKTVSGAEPVLAAGPAAGEWPEFLAAELGTPLKLVSSGPEWTRKVLVGA
jgi:adenylosuccinate synthase